MREQPGRELSGGNIQHQKRFAFLLAGAILVAVLTSPHGASAYNGADSEGIGSHTATSIGARATFYRPTDADHGQWAPGAQLRLHISPAQALECSADFTRYPSMGTNVHVTPVQVTFMDYLYPETSLSPYLLLGGGWYLTHSDGPYANTQRRFGPHIGAGLELFFGDHWSLDGSYRFLWTEVIGWSHPQYLFGHNFRERGHMLTIGLNYHL